LLRMSKPEAPHSQRFWRAVAAITGVGAAWRLVMLVSKWNVPLAYSDAWYYSIQAINNAHGKWFKEAGGPLAGWGVLPGAEHPPLTSVVITPASLLSHPIFWQRATITLLGIALVPLVAVVARRAVGALVGVIAALIAAVYPNIWMSDSVVMSETLTKLTILLVLLAAVGHIDRFDLRSAALVGAAIGLAGYARSELIFYAPLLALVGVRTYPWREWLRRAAVLVGVTAVVLLPWVAYNTSRFDTLVLMSTNEGNTWLGANCPPTYAGPSMGGWIIGCLDDGPDRPGENTAERSVRRRHEALSFVTAHASRVPLVVAARVLRGADLFRVGENVRADVGEEQPRWAVWAGMICWWVLAPVGAFGLWRVRRRVRYVLLVPVLGVAFVTVVFYGSHRLRAPMEPVVVIAAASALANLSSRELEFA
jgi:hypothetical protein